MEAVAEGLWILAENFEKKGSILQALKCLEAICQSNISFLPIIEVKTRLHIADLLLSHTKNLNQAKSHLERAQILLKQIPSCFDLKCRAYSLQSRCYRLLGAIPLQKQTLKKGLDLATFAGETPSAYMWACNFHLQMANTLVIECDYWNVIRSLDSGLEYAAKARAPQLQMVFATSKLHVYLMHCEDRATLEQAVSHCDQLWISIPQAEKSFHVGLHIYSEILHAFYFLRVCDYKAASFHVSVLDELLAPNYKALADSNLPDEERGVQLLQLQLQLRELQQQMQGVQEQLKNPRLSEQKRSELFALYQTNESQHFRLSQSSDGKLQLGPFPLDGEWLPPGAILALVDLLAAICFRPKGGFKDCSNRLQSGLSLVNGELCKLGISPTSTENNIEHLSVWTVGVYLMLLFQLLENKIVIDLTRTELLEAQESLLQLLELRSRFPTILQSCESITHMLLGHYAHSVGCFYEAVLHFRLGAKSTQNKGTQAMCYVYAAISLICIGDADSSSQALDLIGPVYKAMDSFVGVREKTVVLFASGLLQMKQQNPQTARMRLRDGLKLTHQKLGSHQLMSQYLTVLGSLALAMHDTGQARDILKSSLTLAKALHDVPAQIGVLTELTALYHELGESDRARENYQYQQNKIEELRKLIEAAVSTPSHDFLLKYGLVA